MAQYIPALRFRFLTPLYDRAIALFFDEESLRRPLLDQVRPGVGDRILEVGCGTATVSLAIARVAPGTDIIGLDGDPEVLKLARAKADRQGVTLALVEGLATRLPFPDATFDHVVTSLVLHHLISDDKRIAFREMHRVLRPGGRLHVLDFGGPITALQRAQVAVTRHFEETADNFDGRLPAMAQEAGFSDVSVERTSSTVIGPVALLSARA